MEQVSPSQGNNWVWSKSRPPPPVAFSRQQLGAPPSRRGHAAVSTRTPRPWKAKRTTWKAKP
eukprot:3228288-Alexandrium_andersonii.AAC.1